MALWSPAGRRQEEQKWDFVLDLVKEQFEKNIGKKEREMVGFLIWWDSPTPTCESPFSLSSIGLCFFRTNLIN